MYYYLDHNKSLNTRIGNNFKFDLNGLQFQPILSLPDMRCRLDLLRAKYLSISAEIFFEKEKFYITRQIIIGIQQYYQPGLVVEFPVNLQSLAKYRY